MKQKIIKTALKHFAINGYKNTSMQDIAKELNITKPALYYHFKNKNDLYNAIFIYFFS
ncbi:TetR/AcrR family transcriptional regulator [Lebetimonas sp. JH292]|uniref:TetR/AcrR family transcriptional regulator n=1 Tax=Lebetimonas sp. JH292 TaxID=990068 RepID=UPI0004ADB7C3|nr:TetR/AcrR family transcriptional regulator [Lebetimonas sp. JH292]